MRVRSKRSVDRGEARPGVALSHFLWTGCVLFLSAWTTLRAEPPKQLSVADISSDVLAAKQANVIGLAPGDYIVDGNRLFNGYTLAVERLVFKPGSKLVFSAQALRQRDTFLIVANEVTSLDPNNPGTITWSAEGTPEPGRPVPGQASTGSHGAEDTDGSQGATGASGNDGTAGRKAPRLVIFVKSVPTSKVSIAFSGQPGGRGGPGQKGGDGGNGGPGHSGSQNLFNCTRGPGNGGKGGTGGAGGVGGRGGAGGDGGTVVVTSLAANLPLIQQEFSVDVAGGQGGASGEGGPGGRGGLGGPVGAEQLPYCTRGGRSDGPDGGTGLVGGQGQPGPGGTGGDFFVAALTEAQLNTLFQP